MINAHIWLFPRLLLRLDRSSSFEWSKNKRPTNIGLKPFRNSYETAADRLPLWIASYWSFANVYL